MKNLPWKMILVVAVVVVIVMIAYDHFTNVTIVNNNQTGESQLKRSFAMPGKLGDLLGHKTTTPSTPAKPVINTSGPVTSMRPPVPSMN